MNISSIQGGFITDVETTITGVRNTDAFIVETRDHKVFQCTAMTDSYGNPRLDIEDITDEIRG